MTETGTEGLTVPMHTVAVRSTGTTIPPLVHTPRTAAFAHLTAPDAYQR